MNTAILIVAHAPLASALRECVLHVFPEAAEGTAALDVAADESVEHARARAQDLMAQTQARQTLILTDVMGATPCNVAHSLVDGERARLVAGVNLPMLLRAVNYLDKDLDTLLKLAIAGGVHCILQVEPAPVTPTPVAP